MAPTTALVARTRTLVARSLAATAAAAVAVTLVPAGAQAATPAAAQQQVRTVAARTGSEIIDSLVQHQVSGSPMALWANPTGACARCQAGPALAAAALATRTGKDSYVRVATRTFDASIAKNRDAKSGAFRGFGSTSISEVETAFFAGSLGVATVRLGSRLDAAHRANYTKVVAGAADFLRRNGNATYYTNGNINLANSVVFLSAYRLTGSKAYLTTYQQALSFVIKPTGAQWAGRGLVLTRKPTKADWSDAAGYFTEENRPSKPGFDPEYTLLQADMLMQLDMLAADPTPHRLLNAVVNRQLPLINKKVWVIDVSSGSRHPEPNRIFGYSSAGISYLGTHGRADLLPYAAAAATAATGDLKHNAGMYQPGARFSYGTTFAALTF